VTSCETFVLPIVVSLGLNAVFREFRPGCNQSPDGAAGEGAAVPDGQGTMADRTSTVISTLRTRGTA
jgi:hypothetical protein